MKPTPPWTSVATFATCFPTSARWAQEARDILEQLNYGPVFTPPSLQGTVEMPGWAAGADWGGATFDPQMGYFVTFVGSVKYVGDEKLSGRVCASTVHLNDR